MLATTAGQTYLLSFFVAEDAGPTSEFSVSWGGAMVADVVNPANNTLPGYVQHSYDLLSASGTATALEIPGRQDPAGIYFDDISVTADGTVTGTAVPEPHPLPCWARAWSALWRPGAAARLDGTGWVSSAMPS